jgi:hypothetical protein
MSSTISEVISTSLPGLLPLQKQTQPKKKTKKYFLYIQQSHSTAFGIHVQFGLMWFAAAAASR